MTASNPDNALRCPSCEHRYRVPEIRSDRVYLCVRCDVLLTESGTPSMTSSGRRLQPLYGGSGPTETAMPADSTGGLADQTWVEGLDDLDEDLPDELGAVGRYALQAELGRGGMGVVYRAFDADLGRPVAVKLLLHGGHAGQAQIERFLREARAGARLDHPHLVRVTDIGRHEGQVFFTMDLVDGPSVADVIDEVGRFSTEEAARIAAEAAKGVHHAHLSGIVHRDLKPGNVLLDVLGRALVTDFGLVKHVTAEGQQLTATGQVLGTPAYMAPEQARGQAATVRSDVYSLGAVLYEMLSGRPPYTGDNAAGILLKVVVDQPPTVQSITQNLPLDLALVCATAMSREPERRYASALDLAEDLERWRRGEPVLARAPTTAYKVQRWLRQHPRTTAAAAALLAVGLLATGAGLATMVLERQQETARLAAAESALSELLEDVARLDAAGDMQTADRRLDSFVEREDFAQTPAVSRAWLARAERSGRNADLEQQLDEVAWAWRTATDDATRTQTGMALARALKDRWRFQALEAALNTLVARVPETADDPEVQTLRVQAALGRGDLAVAAQRAGDRPIAPVLQALARGLTTDRKGGRLVRGDLDGDGAPELIGSHGTEVVRYTADLKLDPLETGSWREGRPRASALRVVPWEGGDRILASSWQGNASVTEVWRLDGTQLVEEQQIERGFLHAALTADLDRDEVPEIYFGAGMGGRGLHRLDRIEDQWVASTPHALTNALNSDLMSLKVVDLDSDGNPELMAAAGAWGAFDVRLYEPTEDGKLERIARHRVGETLLRSTLELKGPDGSRLLVGKARRMASRSAFPPDDPYGAPAGVYVLTFDGQQLAVEQTLLLTPPVTEQDRLSLSRASVGDIDGDGLEDALYSVRGRGFAGLWVLRQLEDGGFATALIGGMHESTLVDLDSDGDSEMVVPSDSEIRILGAGEPLEPQPLPAPVGGTIADELASIGLSRAAAEAYEARGAWARAGERWTEARQYERAATAYLEAHGADGDPAHLQSALEAQSQAHSFAAAAETSKRLGGTSDVDYAALADAPELVYDFDEALDDRWRVHQPMGLAWNRSDGTLRAELMTWSDHVVTRDLHWDGQRLGMAVQMTLERGEWGSMPRIALVMPGEAERVERRIGVGAQTVGGGGLWIRRVGCLRPGALEDGISRPIKQGDQPWALEIEVDYARELERMRCTVRLDGEVVFQATERMKPLAAGPVQLALYGTGETMETAATVLAIDRISVTGATEADGEPLTDWERGGLGWVNRSPELARKAWADAELDAEQTVGLAIALAAAGDVRQAAETLPSWAAGSVPRTLQSAVRADPLRVGLLLSTVDPTLPIRVMDQSTAVAQLGHSSEEWVGRLLDQGLTGLDSAPEDEPVETRAARLRLLLTRGRVFREAGSAKSALQDLRQVLALAGEDPPEDLRGMARTAHKALALALAEDGDGPGALEHAHAALELIDARIVEQDYFRTRPELAPYLDQPEWRALLDDGPELLPDGTERRPR